MRDRGCTARIIDERIQNVSLSADRKDDEYKQHEYLSHYS